VADHIRVVVAVPDEGTANLIHRVVAHHRAARVVATVDTDVRLVDAVTFRRPQLVFVSTDLADMRGFDVADRLSRQHPGLYIAMVSPRNRPEELRRAMKAGARECLFEPLSEEAIARVLDEARDFGGPVAARRGAVVAVMSSKGGVGKSTLAANLAVALRQLDSGRVALVDGDLYFGDIALLLNIKPERTIYELNTALDAEVADRFLLPHASGVEVLAAPVRTEQAEEIGADRFRSILSVLQDLYEFVVVDATVSSLETMLATLDVADVVLAVSTLDVVCLKDVAQLLEMLAKLRFPPHNILMVGNRYDERISVAQKDAERALGRPFTMVLPRDDRVVAAANRGVPLLLSEPGAPFSQRVVALARTLRAQIGRVDRVTA
jgi:pilus assembly protein CpaE